jgi:cytidylate kinase
MTADAPSARRLVIAIDGPSGAGKSTAGRALAARLGYTFLDTGAMYRAVALRVLRAGVDPTAEDAVFAVAEGGRIELDPGGRVALDGADVTAEIRSREVTAVASRVSVHPRVRRLLVARQRAMGAEGGVVMDGRDIGTRVFPDADVKFYLDADPRHRAERRLHELEAAGVQASVDAIEADIRERDHQDSTRPDSPLTRAADAVHIDTTSVGPDGVLARMLSTVAGLAAR